MKPDRKKKIENGAADAAKRLADWIMNFHGAQDWDVKVDECSEPVAAALGIPYETFRALVAERCQGVGKTPQTVRREP